MIELRGQSEGVKLRSKINNLVCRLEQSDVDALSFDLVTSGPVSDYGVLRLSFDKENLGLDGDWIIAPESLSYLKIGDVISLSADGRMINALWRGNGSTNTLLLTERCDNYCLMCSQPPKKGNDDWLLEQAFEVISLMPKDAVEIGLSGGEPTLYGSRFVDLVGHIRSMLPETALHILSNGRKFADPDFAAEYAGSTSPGTMIGIPIYGSESSLHDYVVQAEGAFQETLNGILNLGELGQAIEIRVVLHAATAPHIVEIADFIARNLPFVDQVALMGLEMTGLARRNKDRLWIEPADYKEDLAEAVQLLDAHGIFTLVYNHQLCLLHHDIWNFAVKSISDWKNEYDPVCSECDVVDQCGGFFYSAKYGSSSQIRPLNSDGSPKGLDSVAEVSGASTRQWIRRPLPLTVVDMSD
jgi:His-Xaa-Ser system radical SAM maturase HxsC